MHTACHARDRRGARRAAYANCSQSNANSPNAPKFIRRSRFEEGKPGGKGPSNPPCLTRTRAARPNYLSSYTGGQKRRWPPGGGPAGPRLRDVPTRRRVGEGGTGLALGGREPSVYVCTSLRARSRAAGREPVGGNELLGSFADREHVIRLCESQMFVVRREISILPKLLRAG